jgi:integrase/recombinase XerD
MEKPATSVDLIEEWLEASAAERGTANSSLQAYRTSARCWADFLSKRGTRIDQASRADFSDYLGHLDARHLSEATIGHRRTVVRSLYRFLVSEEMADLDPTSLVAPMKRPQRLPIVLTMAEVDRLVETAHAQARDESVGLYRQAGYARRAALFEVLYASGMRVSEAVNLPAKAIASGANSMIVTGKGGKDRLVPLHDRAIEAVRFWRSLAAAYGSKSEDWVFHPVRNGRTALTRQSALAEIKEAAVAAGIPNPDRVSPHKLRHAFASHLLSNGANLREIQEMLGHADLGTTEVYLHTDMSRTAAMVRDLHPLGDRPAPDGDAGAPRSLPLS